MSFQFENINHFIEYYFDEARNIANTYKNVFHRNLLLSMLNGLEYAIKDGLKNHKIKENIKG